MENIFDDKGATGSGHAGDAGDDASGTGGTTQHVNGTASEYTDPATFQRPAADDDFLADINTDPRQRTRASRQRAGSTGTEAPKASVRLDQDAFTWGLMSLHTMVAAAIKVHEAEISEEEARKIAEATARVASFYTGAMSDKAQAWSALMIVLGGVYGSRAVAYMLRQRAERESLAEARRAAANSDPRAVNLRSMG